MLKITKGLKPYVEDGIMPYTDSKGEGYVRVKMNGEDFCIATQDYNKDGKEWFTWDDAMKSLKADELTTFTKDQALICKDNQIEINDILKKMGGNKLKNYEWYWTVDEYDVNCAWGFYIGNITNLDRENQFMIRPVLNL
jgi:hypothetical protein